jgi:hypothetical protein
VADAKTIVQAGDTAVKSTAAKDVGVKSTPAESARLKSTLAEPPKSASMEPAMEPTTPAVGPSSGEVRLAEGNRAQQCSGNARHRPPLSGPGSAIA